MKKPEVRVRIITTRQPTLQQIAAWRHFWATVTKELSDRRDYPDRKANYGRGKDPVD